MKYLDNKSVYLGGAIEMCPESDNKVTWRDEVKSVLTNRFKLSVFDPLLDPKQQKSEQMRQAREVEDYDTLAKIAKDFVRKDLAMTDKMDILISRIPKDIATFGSTHEIINCHDSKKLVFLVGKVSKRDIPSWFYGFIEHDQFFGTFEELYEHLDRINNGDFITDRRYNMIYGVI